MPEPKIAKYETPRELYFRQKGNAWPHKATCHGETSRSYLVGSQWRPRKIAKSAIDLITEQEYREAYFAINCSSKIGEMVRDLRDPAKLRQIAEIVGYTEGKS